MEPLCPSWDCIAGNEGNLTNPSPSEPIVALPRLLGLKLRNGTQKYSIFFINRHFNSLIKVAEIEKYQPLLIDGACLKLHDEVSLWVC